MGHARAAAGEREPVVAGVHYEEHVLGRDALATRSLQAAHGDGLALQA